VPREPTSPLFVRLPTASAEKLNRAAFELKTPKRELVTELVDRYLGAENLPDSAPGGDEPEVLTLEQIAELLQVDESAVRALAAKGDLPGRKLDNEWRFSRKAVLEWLATLVVGVRCSFADKDAGRVNSNKLLAQPRPSLRGRAVCVDGTDCLAPNPPTNR
jgi:excisionase family DNA binding protein